MWRLHRGRQWGSVSSVAVSTREIVMPARALQLQINQLDEQHVSDAELRYIDHGTLQVHVLCSGIGDHSMSSRNSIAWCAVGELWGGWGDIVYYLVWRSQGALLSLSVASSAADCRKVGVQKAVDIGTQMD